MPKGKSKSKTKKTTKAKTEEVKIKPSKYIKKGYTKTKESAQDKKSKNIQKTIDELLDDPRTSSYEGPLTIKSLADTNIPMSKKGCLKGKITDTDGETGYIETGDRMSYVTTDNKYRCGGFIRAFNSTYIAVVGKANVSFSVQIKNLRYLFIMPRTNIKSSYKTDAGLKITVDE
jgi:hypothetical protein